MTEKQHEVRILFLTLWDKAVGTPKYDKAQWKRLDALLGPIVHPLAQEPKLSSTELIESGGVALYEVLQQSD